MERTGDSDPATDTWKSLTDPPAARPSLRALAQLIEVTAEQQQAVSEQVLTARRDVPTADELVELVDLLEVDAKSVAPSPGPVASEAPARIAAEVMPTIPPAARLPDMEAAPVSIAPSDVASMAPPEQLGASPSEVPTREVMPSTLPQPTVSRLPPTPGSTINIHTLEDLVSQNQWTKVCSILGAPENQGKLPVGLAFIYAIALNEIRVPGSTVDKRAPDIERIAQRCISVMLGTDPKGQLTQIIAKRLMRRNWRTAPAPPARTSILLLIAALAVGSFVGFLLGPGHDWFKSM